VITIEIPNGARFTTELADLQAIAVAVPVFETNLDLVAARLEQELTSASSRGPSASLRSLRELRAVQ
jgi:hypothetical protein